MSALYSFYKLVQPPILNLFFAKSEQHNYEKNVPVGEPIIFVANHPSALIDPLVCGAFIKVPIFFLGRADIFKKKFNNWFLRKSHMWPIYRDVDGKDALEKNKIVFKECYESLIAGNPILLYGEGFTDESFIRRVKKIKKGAARIALGAEEAYDFEMGLKIIPIGINYSNPAVRDSDVLINFSEPIALKSFKEDYKESNVKVALSITRQIEKQIIENTTHIDNKELYPLFEKLLFFFKDTMHYSYADVKLSVREKWEKTKRFADQFNNYVKDNGSVDCPESIQKLDTLLSTPKTRHIDWLKKLEGEKLRLGKELMLLILLSPFFVLGYIMNGPMVNLINYLTPKLVKRVCFHSGMRVAMPMLLMPLYYTLIWGVLCFFIDIPFLWLIIVALGIFSGEVYLKYVSIYRSFVSKTKINQIFKKDNIKAYQQFYKEGKAFSEKILEEA